MSRDTQSTYSEFAAIVDRLPDIVLDARRARGLSNRAAARQIGFSFNTLRAIEAGESFTTRHLTMLLRWLDQSAGVS